MAVSADLSIATLSELEVWDDVDSISLNRGFDIKLSSSGANVNNHELINVNNNHELIKMKMSKIMTGDIAIS